eukprot:CAMPEP_0197003874 /NCGR_PEP_ID=MMETSP1380-20130617/15300_1 /TAXON_ID=5936 /ORGANISM="Euplotes crassus, Strain CT5" /LENGTH=145 /DNA_ID=CAMNT_0042422489 /DNA_START=23 /DNA_END=460 /DNA_ORIENTATION=+
MSSGVSVNDEVVTTYNDLKTGRKYKYVLYKMNNDFTEIVVDKVVPAGASYDDFINDLKALPKEECRYAVYDFEWNTSDGGLRQKICFYVWCPDTSKMKAKMLYASSKDAIRKKLVGLGAEIQGTDWSEVDYETVLERVSRGAGNQ